MDDDRALTLRRPDPEAQTTAIAARSSAGSGANSSKNEI
jgi:hypothetical protein